MNLTLAPTPRQPVLLPLRLTVGQGQRNDRRLPHGSCSGVQLQGQSTKAAVLTLLTAAGEPSASPHIPSPQPRPVTSQPAGETRARSAPLARRGRGAPAAIAC